MDQEIREHRLIAQRNSRVKEYNMKMARPVIAALMLTAASLFAAEKGAAIQPSSEIALSGEIGAAEAAVMKRLSERPYNWLNWLRADLTGERNPQFDKKFGDPMNRPFKEYSGDVSGRYIEIMSVAQSGTGKPSPLLAELISEALKNQRKGGYFCASGEADWSQPVNTEVGRKVLLPALWGNGRMLCGLTEASRAFKDPAALVSAQRLGDFYVRILPRFTDQSRIAEFKHGDTYASSFVTCYFPAMEGLVKLYRITKEKRYLDTAASMAEFYKSFDHLPIDHSHGMLCSHVSLLMLYEETKDEGYLERVEKRWIELVDGGYITPLGAPLEKCRVNYKRDEGCATADWLRLNLALGRVTGKPKYWAMAERALHNHFLQDQALNGGFGHRQLKCDYGGVKEFTRPMFESTWCCTYHGELGFLNLRNHVLRSTKEDLTCNFALDFTCSADEGKILSRINPARKPGEILRQQISIDGQPRLVGVRIPHWADSVLVTDREGKALGSSVKNGYCSTQEKVSDVVFIYRGGVFAENRRCARLPEGPVAGKACTLWYGPKLLVKADSVPKIPEVWPAIPGEGKNP